MEAEIDTLVEFGVPTEVRVFSFHRTPAEMLVYARGAAGRGLRVIIAGANGAAHLPGMIASATPLPAERGADRRHSARRGRRPL